MQKITNADPGADITVNPFISHQIVQPVSQANLLHDTISDKANDWYLIAHSQRQ